MNDWSGCAGGVLLIKAKGGLGNRMLSGVTGLTYAELTGRIPIIDWRDGLYAPVGENAYPILFRSPRPMYPERLNEEISVTPEIWRGNLNKDPSTMISAYHPEKHRSPLIYRRYCVELNRRDLPEKVAVYWSYLPKFGRLQSLLRSDARFVDKEISEIAASYLRKYFTPNSRVETEVARLFRGMRRPVIGVHVRYTDLKVPLQKIETALRRRIEKYSNKGSVYLATDNLEIQDAIGAKFDNVFVHHKRFGLAGQHLHGAQAEFDKITEGENALIDMWALSKCDHLVYSKTSTFSAASALIGGLRRDQQDDVDRHNPYVTLKRLIQNYL